MTLLSDSSDTETDNEEEEMIAELNHLQKSVDLGGINYYTFYCYYYYTFYHKKIFHHFHEMI